MPSLEPNENTNRTKRSKDLFWILAIILLALAIRLPYIFTFGLGADPANFFDDALITLRYSQNIAAGNGFVYNVGEKVLGTTTPLYALLMSLPALLHLDLPWAAVLANLLFDILTSILLFRIAKGHAVFRILAPILYLLHPRILIWSTSGMEMSLLVFLVLFTNWLFWKESYVLSGIGAALIVLCRIDGVLAVAALLFAKIIVHRRTPIRFILSAALALLPWILFAFFYFGTFIPQSATAKIIMYAIPNVFDVWRISMTDIVFLPFVFLGMWVIALKYKKTGKDPFNNWLFTLVAWMLLFGLFFMVEKVKVASWYRVPQHTVIMILAACGFQATVHFLSKFIAIPKKKPVILAGSVVVLILFIAAIFGGAGSRLKRIVLAQKQPSMTAMHLEVGKWLKDNSRPKDVVFAGNIGFIGYYSNRKILDLVGLVSPEVMPYMRETTKYCPKLLRVFKPEYLALEQREYDDVKEAIGELGYVLMGEYPYKGIRPCELSPYRIFARPD